jgi:hypothetical protein
MFENISNTAMQIITFSYLLINITSFALAEVPNRPVVVLPMDIIINFKCTLIKNLNSKSLFLTGFLFCLFATY